APTPSLTIRPCSSQKHPKPDAREKPSRKLQLERKYVLSRHAPASVPMTTSHAPVVRTPRASGEKSFAPQPRSAPSGRTLVGSSPNASLSPGRIPRHRGQAATLSAVVAPLGRGLAA